MESPYRSKKRRLCIVVVAVATSRYATGEAGALVNTNRVATRAQRYCYSSCTDSDENGTGAKGCGRIYLAPPLGTPVFMR